MERPNAMVLCRMWLSTARTEVSNSETLMVRSKFYFALISIWSAFFLTWPSSSEAAYPDRAVHIVVTFGVGGGSDVLARLVGNKLSEKWGQPVVIDNRPGANGTIGLGTVVSAAPDGYTLALYSLSHVIAPYFYKVNYDTITGIKPICLLAEQPDLLVVNSSLPVTSVQELIALAKSKPGQLNYGSYGTAIPGTLTMELLKKEGGLDIAQIVYKDGTPVVGLLRGETQIIITTMSTLLPMVNAGKFRALAVSGTGKQRLATLPNIPTLAEATGLPGFDRGGSVWYGFAAPPGTPDDIINKIYADLVIVMKSPEFQDTLSKQGLLVTVKPPKEFDTFIKDENARWGTLIKSLGIQPQ